MKDKYPIPSNVRLSRAVLRAVFRGVFHILSRVVINGLENVPESGAYLIAINHISLFEAPLLVSFWPVAPEVAGASDVWDRPGQSILARLYGGIPVHRGQFDRRLIDATLAALRSGFPLLIAPEGGRSHTPGMQPAHPGVAYLMDKASVPVVPVGIVGSTDDFLQRALRGKRPTIEMHIGQPVNLPPVEGRGAARREMRQRNADLVMAHIAALLPPEYQGVYRLEKSENNSE
ncbi:MAG: 1-acyl-sn-glycerol-3-phosphate acyltransferase [Chloroflexi bacterium]|nr:1-acyl-sn-glycerol-3-phosphate acyltransferase [Chloroflexota bacterium]